MYLACTFTLCAFFVDIFSHFIKEFVTNLEHELTAFSTEYAKVVKFQIDKARGPIELYGNNLVTTAI
jgi:hypothetical protein